MPQLIVVDSLKTFIPDVPGAQVVSARAYLTEKRFVEMRRATVFNLCRNNAYQSEGYYVSLLAAARGHRPLPSLSTIQNLRQLPLVKIASGDLDGLIQKSLHGLKHDEFELSIYFGKNLAAKYDRLCQALFDHFPAPLLRAKFIRQGSWKLAELRSISMQDVPETHHEFFGQRASRYFNRPRTSEVEAYRFEMAILVNPEEEDAPSDEKAIARMIRAAKQLKIRATVIGREQYPRLAEYDALFIRETTSVTHHTYRFASRAQKEGLVVLDDPESILKCCNKVYQAELFSRHNIPCPKTLIVHKGNRKTVEAELGLPCVLKKPDSAFSQGVVKAETSEELKRLLDQLLDDSDLVVAQSFAPSEFDFRVGIIGGKAIYVCRYFMARGHWQIQKNDGQKKGFGRHETLAVKDAPAHVVALAERAAGLIGDGLYGVDIKEYEGKLLVMEINDNPNIESGVEDLAEKNEVYARIMGHFYELLEKKGSRA